MRPVRKADNLPPFCTVVTKSGNLNFLEPSGPAQACNGIAFPLPLPHWIILRMIFQAVYKNQNIFYVQSLPPPENRTVYEIMWKNIVEPDRPHDNIVRCLRIVCSINKATDAHSEYVIILALFIFRTLFVNCTSVCHGFAFSFNHKALDFSRSNRDALRWPVYSSTTPSPSVMPMNV